MMMQFRRSLPLQVLPLLLLLAAIPAAGADPPDPDPEAEDALGLDSLRGKVVLVDFWASWCVPCAKSFPWMNSLFKEYGDEGLVIVAVNVDKKREAADAFLEKHGAEFSIAYDPEGRLAKGYALRAMPSSYFYDRWGNLRERHLGFQEEKTADLENILRELLSEEEEAKTDE